MTSMAVRMRGMTQKVRATKIVPSRRPKNWRSLGTLGSFTMVHNGPWFLSSKKKHVFFLLWGTVREVLRTFCRRIPSDFPSDLPRSCVLCDFKISVIHWLLCWEMMQQPRRQRRVRISISEVWRLTTRGFQ